jgi:signal transduction histidine kinase
MTYRLIGLMSFVLLLCMATFAMLTRLHEKEIMDELARTVASVGQQTFRSLENGSLLISGTGSPNQETFTGSGAVELLVEDNVGPLPGRTIRKFQIKDEGDGSNLFIIETVQAMGSNLDTGTEQNHLHERIEDRVEEIETGARENVVHTQDTHVIRIDAIRAETDATRGILLRIPSIHGAPQGTHGFTTAFDFHSDGSEPPAGLLEEIRKAGLVGGTLSSADIVLPVSTSDYQSLFHTMQTRWLMMFAGVFVVGLILSSGLAARFTRPVRKLDAGLRRLSEGDLDVEVEVHGKDEIARLGAAFNEMTARLRAGREREREVTRREKLSALGSLAAGVAHDVRNPLHSIGLTLQHLQETSRLILKEAEWRNIQVQVDVQDPLPEFPADIEAIRSSILNLALNSFAAMPEGGVLTLSARQVQGGLEIAIADTGAGISDQELEKVFDFGYSTREDGNGLGLAMVHQCIVDNHGGRIDLASREGEGTTFRLFFPIAEDA